MNGGYLMVKKELISVIIPCFNSERWLRDTLDSVFKQSYPVIEVIVVDDGSTDNSKDIISNYNHPITYIYQKNQGPSVARNVGIQNARGDYIAFLDSDDLWDENKLYQQVDYLEKNKDVALVFSNVRVIDEKSNYVYTHFNKIPQQKGELIKAFFLGKIGMNTPTIVARKVAIDSIGGVDESLPMREDHHFLMRMAENYSIYHFKEPLVSRRMNEGSLSQGIKAERVLPLFEPFIRKSVEEFPQLTKYRKNAFAKIYMLTSKGYWRISDYKKSIKYILKAIYYNPLVVRNYFMLILVLFHVEYENFTLIKRKLKNKIRN
jgi:glycosyltransferase involved in cell wall biosynthesis